MTKFASKSAKGFYTPEIHGENMPTDVVEISDELYSELIDGQSQGKVIDWDSEDFPVLSDPEPPSIEKIAEEVRLKRERLFREIYDPALMLLLRMQRTSPSAQQAAIASKIEELDAYAILLQDIPSQPGFPTDVIWPIMPSKEL